MIRFVFILLLGISLSHCSVEDVELVRINNVGVAQTLGDKPQLNVNVTLNNPNKFDIKIKKTNINLIINGNDGGKIDLGEKVIIEKLKEGDYDIVLVADKAKLQQAITASGISIAMTGKVTVNIKGWIKGKAFGLGKKIEINEAKTLSLKDLNLPTD